MLLTRRITNMNYASILLLSLALLPTRALADESANSSLPAARGLNLNLTSSQVQGLASFLYSKGVTAANSSSPVMIWDFVGSQWMYGVAYQMYRSDTLLQGLVPTKYQSAVTLPAVNFSIDVAAPVTTQRGTPLLEASMDLTNSIKQGLLLGVNRLPDNLRTHLSGVVDILKSDANGAGILSVGGTGGRDYNQGAWVGGLALHLKVKFGSAPSAPVATDSVGQLLAPSTDTPTAPAAPDPTLEVPTDSVPSNP